MNHLFQVARRTGKPATGYKVQLAVHRMSAHLPASYDGVELCAVITRHKKRIVTKCACYLVEKKEVVWGDILPFTCTLYLSKTGLYQPKVFNIQIFDTRTDHQIASFEFNLAELVQSNKDSSKESIMVPAVKCQDPRASLSLTVVAYKATSKAPRSPGEPEGSNADEMSFDGSRSDMSVITLESKSSRTSMSGSRYRQQGGGMTSPHGDSKSDVLRGAHPTGDSNDAVELYNLRSKHQELLRSVQELEEHLRQSESENVKLEKKLTEKDLAIQKLQTERDELELQLREIEQRDASSSNESGETAQRVESMRHVRLREENRELLEELEKLKQALSQRDAIPPPLTVKVNILNEENSEQEEGEKDSDSDSDEEEQGEEPETRDDKRSEVSSANEYVDAHDTQLIAEINELKVTLHTMKTENQQQQNVIMDLTKLKEKLTGLLQDMEAKVESLESENGSQQRRLEEQEEMLRRNNDVEGEQEEMERRRHAESSEVREENEKLVQQLNHLDHIVTQLKEEKAALTEKLIHAETNHARATKDMEEAQEAINHLSGTNTEISEQLEEAQEASKRAKGEIETAQLTIDELRSEVREISEKLQSTQIELDRVRDVELASSTAAAAAAIVKNQELQGRWDDLKLQNDQLQERVEELEQQLARTEASGEEREADLQRQVEELKHETAQLREELEELRVSKQKAEEELHECTIALKQALENQQRQATEHESVVDSLHMEKEDARSLLEKQSEEKVALEEAMKKRVAELQQENDYFQGELIDSKMKLAELMVKNEELSAQYHRVEKALAELKAKAAEPPAKKK